jgi:seryl-tRNA synthetase
MLDRKFVVENVDAVAQNCVDRGVEIDVASLVEQETARRELQQRVQELNRLANEVSKSIGQAKDPAERESRKAEGRKLREQKEELQREHDRCEAEILEIQKGIPNMTHPAAPVGKTDKDNLELRRGAHAPREFDFEPLDHVDIGSRLGLFDFEAGSRTTGHGFYFLRGDAVRLELALQQYAIDLLVQEGFTPLVTPDLCRDEIVEGVGFIPRGPETQIYSIADSPLSLVATAEITLAGMYAEQTLKAEDMPLRLCGISHCFRTEAGAHGRATRGLYRVHQFTKVEMFAFSLPETSDALLDELCALECRIFDELEIPFRVVDTATGDLGGPAYRKFDLEAWMPGRGEAGDWGEVTSTSNCTDYQSRRLHIRYKSQDQKGTRFVHTLNGTALALSRAVLAILENHQQADGSVRVPPPLQKWMGQEFIVPRGETAK